LRHAEIPNDAILDSILKDLVAGTAQDSPPTSLIPALTFRAKAVIAALITCGDYRQAQLYEDVHTSLVDLMIVRKVQDHRATKLQSLQANISEFERHFSEEQQRLQKSLTDHRIAVERSLKDEEERWARDSAAFDAVTNGPLPPGARKFTSQLLNLRAQERFLLSSRRYGEAAQLKAEADEVEVEEVDRLLALFVTKRTVQKALLREAHDQKLAAIQAEGRRRADALAHAGERTMQRLSQAIGHTRERAGQLNTGDSAPRSV
jgi:hypothetical protein